MKLHNFSKIKIKNRQLLLLRFLTSGRCAPRYLNCYCQSHILLQLSKCTFLQLHALAYRKTNNS